MKPARVLSLTRANQHVEVSPAQWAGMIAFLAECGWESTVPAFVHENHDAVIGDADAIAFAAVGEAVLDEATKDPAGMVASIRFDLGKFAEIVTFAAIGGFTLRN